MRLVVISSKKAIVFEVKKSIATFEIENYNDITKEDIEAIRTGDYTESPVREWLGRDLHRQLSTLPWGNLGITV